MRALAFVGPGQMNVVQQPDPMPGPGAVRVRVAYCGVCGSDLHEFALASPLRLGGLLSPIMGHEATGEVDAVGKGAPAELLGRAVAVNPAAPCGACFYCANGLVNLCRTAYAGGIGYGRPGGYAEYLVAQPNQLVLLPDASSLRSAAVTEPLAVALHILKRAAFQPGERLLITGAGPIGLLVLVAARRARASLIAVVEPAPQRRRLAAALGADMTLDPSTDGVLAAASVATGGLGVDLAAECSGNPAAVDLCLAAARAGGRVAIAGVTDAPHPVDLMNLLTAEKTVLGCLGYAAEFQEAADLLVSGQIDASPLISDVVSLAALPALFSAHASGDLGHHKVLVDPSA